MDHIEKLLKDCEQGSLGRRQLLQALGLAATAAFGAGVLPKAAAAYGGQAAAGGRTFPVTHVNHLSYASPNYAKTRDFYVDLFGMRVVWDNGKQCGLESSAIPRRRTDSHQGSQHELRPLAVPERQGQRSVTSRLR